MNLFRRLFSKKEVGGKLKFYQDPKYKNNEIIKIKNVCVCMFCGNHNASPDDKCFYCKQYQPTSILKPNRTIEEGYVHVPYLPIDQAYDVKTLHGVNVQREMSFIDIPTNLGRSSNIFQVRSEPRLTSCFSRE